MSVPTLKSGALWWLATLLLVLLAILATLQYRWLDEVRRADREKTREVLTAGAERFAEDFDREVTRVFLMLQPMIGSRIPEAEDFARKLDRWNTYAPFPELVRELLIARFEEAGEEKDGKDEDRQIGLERFEATASRFESIAWPTELDSLKPLLQKEPWPRRSSRGSPRLELPSFDFLADQVPAIVIPMFGPPPGGPRRSGPPFLGPRRYLVIWLDRQVIEDELIPQLAARYLRASDGSSYRHRIARRDGSTIAADTAEADVSTPFFRLLPADKLPMTGLETELRSRSGPRPERSERRSQTEHDGWRAGPHHGESRRVLRFYNFIQQEADARWRLDVSHPAGSLELAVARAHRRNVAVSFGILLVLAVSLVLILLSTRRLQALARQQLEFVAGVSHELLTPLAAMRSAGQNLADGVVDDRAQVRRYGQLIEDEGRRLTTMVGQTLELAGMQAGRTYSLQPTRLEAVVDEAVAEMQPLFDEQGFSVERQITPDLPAVMADRDALRRAVSNLLGNAVKYAPEVGWIGIRASLENSSREEILLSVEDRGPGITSSDMGRLFEPFYRGRHGIDNTVPGSGLGLSLVKHIAEGHGGRVAVESIEGQGSTFTLHLPAIQTEAGDLPETDHAV